MLNLQRLLTRPGRTTLWTGVIALAGCLGPAAQAQEVGWDASAFTWPESVSPEAVTLEGGVDIRWVPEPFEFVAGESVKYIDFEGGDDANPGTKERPWKHHPWDDQATGNAAEAEGAQTYVFKRGVTYRGALVADESGTEAEPIRLTSDPSWGSASASGGGGEGEAIVAGSAGIDGGWERVSAGAAKQAGLPADGDGVLWSVKLDGDAVPQALWLVDGEGNWQRQTLARWPDWQVEHPYNHYTQWLRVDKFDKGFPRTTVYSKSLQGYDKDAFKGATMWIDMPVTSGEFSILGPVPTSVGSYDPGKGSLQPMLNHPVRHPHTNSPFYLENLPRFLDKPGEWYFSAKGNDARTLYLRLPDGQDPNRLGVEAAARQVTLDIVDQQHVEVSGLTFAGGNPVRLVEAMDVGDYTKPENDSQMPLIRLKGNCQHINLHHLTIRDTAGSGIANFITDKGDVVRDIRVADSRFDRVDNTGIALYRGFNYRKPEPQPKARLTDVQLLRNRMHDIGMRHSDPVGGQGIYINGPEVAELAGNVISWTAAQGIDLHGGKPGGGWTSSYPDTPLVRVLVHRNKVQDTLLQKQDFGGIEYWAQGPAYLYNNLSIDPVGYVAHRQQYHKNHAFYFDHGYKVAIFNSIGYSSERDDAHLGIIGDKFLQEIRNRMNQAFNNTGYNFRGAFSHESRHGEQQHYLANLMINAIGAFHSHYTLDKAEELAFSHNLYAGRYDNFYRRYKGDKYRTLEQWRSTIEDNANLLAADVGWVTDDMPVRDAEAHDFRLTDESAAIDRGVEVFVPWGLYGNVGEWHFRLRPEAPGTVLSYDLYPQSFYTSSTSYMLESTVPGNELKGDGFTAADYEPGVLEDWAPGALKFDGKRTLTLPSDRLVKDFSLGDKENTTFPGEKRKTVRMTDNNFLIEAVLRADAAGGTIAGKLGDDSGLCLGPGRTGPTDADAAIGGHGVHAVGRYAGRRRQVAPRHRGGRPGSVDRHDVRGRQSEPRVAGRLDARGRALRSTTPRASSWVTVSRGHSTTSASPAAPSPTPRPPSTS